MPINNGIIRQVTATIPNAGTTSPAVDLEGGTVVGIILPAAFTGVALTFQASVDNSAFKAVVGTGGSLVSFTVAADRYIVVPPTTLNNIPYLKVISGSAEAGNRDVILLVKQA